MLTKEELGTLKNEVMDVAEICYLEGEVAGVPRVQQLSEKYAHLHPQQAILLIVTLATASLSHAMDQRRKGV